MKKVGLHKVKPDPNGIVGKYFLSDDRCGKILSEIAPMSYLLQFYDGISGNPTAQLIRTLEDVRNFAFFSTVEEWQAGAERVYRNREEASKNRIFQAIQTIREKNAKELRIHNE